MIAISKADQLETFERSSAGKGRKKESHREKGYEHNPDMQRKTGMMECTVIVIEKKEKRKKGMKSNVEVQERLASRCTRASTSWASTPNSLAMSPKG